MTPNRNDSFVPLTPASPRPAGERREFRATVISQSGQAQAFHSVGAAGIPSMANPAPHTTHGEPKVSLQRDGNRVTGIQIQCSCGQVIDLSCVYDTATIAQPAAATQPATIPQSPPDEAAPGKICKDSGKDLPSSKAKKAKTAEKSSGTSAAKRRSA